MQPQPNIQVGVELVTPSLAEQWLQHNLHNRPVRKFGLKRYVERMERGKWRVSPDAIAFDQHGHLRNGQHRLRAVVETGTPQYFIVGKNFEEDVFPFMDGGFQRSLADHLHAEGFTNVNNVAAVLRPIANIAKTGAVTRHNSSGTASSNLLDTDDYIDYAKRYRDEASLAASRASTIASRNPGMTPGAVIGIILCLYGQEHPIEDFITAVVDGIGIEDARSPAYLLRKRLEQARRQDANREYSIRQRNTARMPRYEMLAYWTLAANLWARGEKRTMIKWVPTKQNPFPQPEADLSFWRERVPEWDHPIEE